MADGRGPLLPPGASRPPAVERHQAWTLSAFAGSIAMAIAIEIGLGWVALLPGLVFVFALYKGIFVQLRERDEIRGRDDAIWTVYMEELNRRMDAEFERRGEKLTFRDEQRIRDEMIGDGWFPLDRS
ncbi:MAG: hypothetical protein NXI30_04640 [bacterium]|nr:hypothetical protein [bacterium]